ncbi:hypothetical protein AMTR_s00038p00205010 [Amborella trichopoda]|uniref:Uncharacterized protein n=1 Tax=Amborella trichopoda TaxID=13333 RepID=U5CNE1_AMBTC|nr:hypothetical protein AMTR_s00038p00205010 [Amborella trichopoda]
MIRGVNFDAYENEVLRALKELVESPAMKEKMAIKDGPGENMSTLNQEELKVRENCCKAYLFIASPCG